MADPFADMQEYIDHLHDRIRREVENSHFLYSRIKERSDFIQWVAATYPEVIAQYEAAQNIVRFAEDPPPPTSTFDYHHTPVLYPTKKK